MKGEVIYFDADRGVGFIAGRDGNRYVFDRADIAGAPRLAKGTAVEFSAQGDRAREVAAVGAARAPATNAAAAATAGSVPTIQPGATSGLEPGDVQDQSSPPAMFGHFRRCITVNYANFGGRAPRREFWSFALFSFVALLLVTIAGMALDFATGNMSEVATDGDFAADGAPLITFALFGVAVLGLAVPSVAVTVRRIHDIGLSGWFWLITFVPSVGSLIILVFMLIPSQRHPNRWGPVPAGVRL
jgi:uncharacterized membrane protein YhaH (DUF805 family)/cold shock CspA family protein